MVTWYQAYIIRLKTTVRASDGTGPGSCQRSGSRGHLVPVAWEEKLKIRVTGSLSTGGLGRKVEDPGHRSNTAQPKSWGQRSGSVETGPRNHSKLNFVFFFGFYFYFPLL